MLSHLLRVLLPIPLLLPLPAGTAMAGPPSRTPATAQTPWAATPVMAAPAAGTTLAAPPLVTPIGPALYPVVASPVAATPVAVAPAAGAMPMATPVVYPMVVPTSAASGVYTVKKGAHLAVVARRTGTSLTDLIRLNPNLPRDRLLPAGTRVVLPIPGSW